MAETSEAFSNQMFEMTCGGFATLGLAMGSRLGLFNLMTTFTEPRTSLEIAQASGYKERYVREWLGLMTVSKIIDVSPDGQKFFLPPHRHSTLTGPENMALVSEGIFSLSGVLPELMECFKKNGPNGIPYSKFPEVLDHLDSFYKDNPNKMKEALQNVPPIHKLLGEGCKVADLGCNSGFTTEQLAIAYPKSFFTGMDIAEQTIAQGKNRIKKAGLSNIDLMVQDICSMPSDWTNKWDCVIMRDVAHDVPFTTTLFKEVYRVLKPGGLVLLVDVNLHTNPALNLDNPLARYIYTFSLCHCMPVSLAIDGGEGWGATWGKEKSLELLKDAGIKNLEILHSEGESFYSVGKKI